MAATPLRRLLSALLLLLASAASAQTTVTLTWQGRQRTYLVYTPAGYNPAGPKIPLVMALHAGFTSAASLAQTARWQAKGDAEQFITVYPNGTSQTGSTTSLSWNAYAPSTGNNVDDVGFLNAVLNQVGRQYAVDSTRRYLTGFSNGAWLTFRMGCDFTRRFAALGPLSGSWKYGRDGRCDHGGCNGSVIPGTNPPSEEASVDCVPDRTIPLMFYRGTREDNLPTDRAITDPMVPYFWSRFNQCQTTPVVDTRQRNGDNIERHRYPGCAGNAEVVVMNVVGNSHLWHASATDEFWDFFKRFRRLPTGTVLAAAQPEPALTALSVYPNPATGGNCTLALTLRAAQRLTVELRDLQGRLLRPAHQQTAPAGALAVALPTAGLPAGLYLVQVRTDSGAQTLRLSLER